MGYPERLAKGGYIPPRPKIKRKYMKVVELTGEGIYELEPGQRVVDSRIIHEVVELSAPTSLRLTYSEQRAFPKYKTIIVLECTEYEDAAKD